MTIKVCLSTPPGIHLPPFLFVCLFDGGAPPLSRNASARSKYNQLYFADVAFIKKRSYEPLSDDEAAASGH